MKKTLVILFVSSVAAALACSQDTGASSSEAASRNSDRSTSESASTASASDSPEWWQSQPVSMEAEETSEPASEKASEGGISSEASSQGHPVFFGSKLKATAPAEWVVKKPRVAIIEAEFAVPAAEGDKEDGRFTVMAAGGTVQANIERWYGQFTQPDGADTKDRAKTEEKKIAGHTVHLVDISGSYSDQRGPFAPAVKRPGYRMLAAIIETDTANYFVKFYGPAKTVSEQATAFQEMIEGLEAR